MVMPMARKTKEDTLKTVAAILDAAEAVFIKHGVAKATVAQIAEAADVSKGAVYGHFKNKIEVCVAVCVRGLEPLQSVIQSVKTLKTSPLEALYHLGVEYVRLFFDSVSFRNTGDILYSKCENSPEFAPVQLIRHRWEKKAFQTTEGLIRKAIACGELPAGTNPNMSNIYLHSVVDGLICACYYTDRVSSENPMDTVEAVLRMGISGIKIL